MSDDEGTSVIAQFVSPEGDSTGPQVDLPINVTPGQLEQIINGLLSNDEPLPYSFFLNETEVASSLDSSIADQQISTENVLRIVYQPQAVFRVRAVTRCSSTLAGHTEAILCTSFSPDSKSLISGSGDTTVRVWDLNTETPKATLKGHTKWVLCVAWSPDGTRIASGGMDATIRLWDGKTGEAQGGPMKAHTKWISGLAWEPLHSNKNANRFVSASKDGQLRIWDAALRKWTVSISGHTMAVTCVRWGGEGLIYSCSEDRAIKVWAANDGKLVRSLDGHAHWVNTMALSTDHVLRTGQYDHTDESSEDKDEAQSRALKKYETAIGNGTERLVTGSDDFTLFLWEPTVKKKPLTRMTGHQQLVNQVSFSPDGRYIASASFDKSVRLWDGLTGKFIATLRGHVGAVYQVCWSGDSRMLVSGSKDSTMKVWDLRTRKLKYDLPGHADEVYTVDWSPDGTRVVSGGKDKNLKIWRN